MIELDGNYLEGGGSIVRVALALSVFLNKPFRVTNIRANRPEPGLKNQHLHAIKLLERMCNAQTTGAELGSTEIEFVPGKMVGGEYELDVQTAGSVALVLQSVLLPCLFAEKATKLTIKGGTATEWSPPMEYFNEVFIPQISKYAEIDCKLIKRGYFPKGQGIVTVTIKPKYSVIYPKQASDIIDEVRDFVKHIALEEQGSLIQIKGISHASADLSERHVAERQGKAAEIELEKYKVPVQIQSEYQNTASTGSGITLFAICSKNVDDIDMLNPIRLGSDGLGQKNRRSEDVALDAVAALDKVLSSGAAVDSYLADQLIPFMALFCPAKIKTSKISRHTKTNIYVAEQFVGKTFEIDEESNTISSFAN